MTALTLSRSVRPTTAASSAAVPALTPARAASVHAAPRAARSPLHLTRRGRFFLIGLPFVTGAAALLVVAAVFLLPPTVKASTEPAGAPVTHSVTVQANQTLWEIAAVADPQRDTREVMNDIAELNGLTSSTLHTGQVLEVPSR
ncbi:LysM peptidoglycan-binding domain-containing protein [Kocuria marina]|uniref:LysM peptidoglycan-binding domain-containing protein n=1 Tax=Kocuria marina TaxID=223184 RepID=UPI0011AA33FF|nr:MULTISPECIES: LysM peptidoglycan-binding domain-containing protein [Kocuria]MCT2021839.1 LysM peptidoglycan-binding domain-containing protein [Kocuria marina]